MIVATQYDTRLLPSLQDINKREYIKRSIELDNYGHVWKLFSMLIREATIEDVPAIARVHLDAYRVSYRGIIPDKSLANQSYAKRQIIWAKILEKFPQNNSFIYVAENKSKQVIGFAHSGLERENNPIYQGELYAIYILPNYQRIGIGRDLWQITLNKLNSMGINSLLVWVLAENYACQFYKALKGIEIGSKQLKRGDKTLTAIAYGWIDIASMMN